MIINGQEVIPYDIDEDFLMDLPATSEKDVDKILKYIRKGISKRAAKLEKAGDKDGLNTARREANNKYGKGWRECMITRTIFTRSKSSKRRGSNRCPEEGRDFGYPNGFWQ